MKKVLGVGLAGLSGLVLIAGLFFLSAYIVMVLYNYTVPRVVESVKPDYVKEKDFKKLEFWPSMTLLLLCSTLFGTAVFVVNGNKV